MSNSADFDHRPAAATLCAALGDRRPRLGLVLGSGLGALAEQIEKPLATPFADLPGFPPSTVSGHAGRFIAGRLGGREVLCMQGRLHYYEGHPPAALALPVRVMAAAGVDTLMLTNAAGSLDPARPAGTLMALSDHINWAGVNPLIGANDERVGPRFFDMSAAYDKDLRAQLRRAATATGVALAEGVYVMYPGPNFETPAEIRALQRLGGDAVGMSTVPECLAARHAGLRVAAIATLTNLAAGLSDETLSHEQTLAAGSAAADDLSRLIAAFVAALV